MIKTLNRNKLSSILTVLIFIIFISLVSATTNLDDVELTTTKINITGNLTLGQKITFTFGGMLDNIVNGWLKITGNLNVTGNIETSNNVTANYFIGNGSQLTNLPSGDNSSWNQTHANTLYADISVTGDNSSFNQSLTDTLYITDAEADLNVNSSTWWNSVSGWVTGWFIKTGDNLDLNETKLNESIESYGYITSYSETDPLWTANQSSYSTTTEIIAFGYYNSSDFVITDYFTKTQIENFGYYNSSDFSISDYFTSAEILAFNYYNSSDFDINDYYNSSQIEGFNYYNSSDFDINDYATNVKVDSVGNFSDWDKDYADLTNKPTLLSNFTDDLGDRDYTSNLNFTNDANYWNDTYATFNKTYADTLYITDAEADLNVNSSTWWATISGYASKWFYNSGNDLTLNETQLNSSIEAYGYITSDTNASTACSASEVLLGNGTCHNSTLFYDDTISNETQTILDNNASWVSTYNSTYDAKVTDNSSWNETHADTLYVNTDGDIMTGNLNMSDNNITGIDVLIFTLGETIDNLVNGWIRITGGLNVTGNIISGGNVTADYFFGNGSQLSNLPAGGNLSWNQTLADTLYADSGYGDDWNKTYADTLYITDAEADLNVNSSDYLDTYDSSYFMPLNTTVSGNFDFNGGWLSNGLSIINGDIYAQTGYFYNISSLLVSQLSINGSMLPYVGFNNTFDIGNSSGRWWKDLYLAGKIYFTSGNMFANSTSLYYDNGTTTTDLTAGDQDVPYGAIQAFYLASCPSGWVLADGTDNTPDLRGLFVRGSGTSGVLKDANGNYISATYGEYYNDSFQGHRHDTAANPWTYDVAGGWTVGSADINAATVLAASFVTDPVTDTVHGTPRTSNETRPFSYNTIYCMKISNQKFLTGVVETYDTGWVSNSDWTNQHLGTTAGGNVTHNLDAPLSELDVKVLVSSDGTDANAISVMPINMNSRSATTDVWGLTIFAVDDNNIIVQTGVNGIFYIDTNGATFGLDVESQYYRIVVQKVPEYVGVEIGDYKINGDLNVTGNITNACPSGFTSVESQGSQLGCMQTAEEGSGTWWVANDDCFDTYGGKLPSHAEWYISMNNYALTDETDDAEWVDDSLKVTEYRALTVGSGALTTVNAEIHATSVAYRCWIPR